MARIGRNLNIPTQPSLQTGGSSGSANSATGLTGEQKFNLIIAVSIGFGVACLLAMIAMLASTWQFKSNSYNEYSNTIKEYNDKRYELLENRVKELESRQATPSGI